MRALGLLAAFLATAVGSEAAVLCVRLRPDGSLRGGVRVRESCPPREVQLLPEAVGFCCGAVTTTVTTTTGTTGCAPVTTTTLGIPDCGGVAPACLGLCSNARACVDDGAGGCGCTGAELPCGPVTYLGTCGGTCPPGLTCQLVSPILPNGCPDAPVCGCAP
jgi:hypothetical protein